MPGVSATHVPCTEPPADHPPAPTFQWASHIIEGYASPWLSRVMSLPAFHVSHLRTATIASSPPPGASELLRPSFASLGVCWRPPWHLRASPRSLDSAACCQLPAAPFQYKSCYSYSYNRLSGTPQDPGHLSREPRLLGGFIEHKAQSSRRAGRGCHRAMKPLGDGGCLPDSWTPSFLALCTTF